MQLTKRYIDISAAAFDAKTFVDGATLHISKEELTAIAADPRFSRVEFDLAVPGEECRLMNVGDIVQPAVRRGQGAPSFPGVVDPIGTVGNGETIVLRGIAVAEILEVEIPLGTFVDMFGPAAEHTPFSRTINLTVDAFPAPGVHKNDYLDALNKASKRIAKYLARAAENRGPNGTEQFALRRDGTADLPDVVYIFQIFSHAPYTDTTYYGGDCAKMMPLIIHPNEVLDGALCNRNYFQLTNADPTYLYQNQPLILELYRRHGIDLNFRGVILSNSPHELSDKTRNAMMAANLAKFHLRADAAVITKEGGGHPQIDLGLLCDNCENYGIKTAILITEFLSPDNAADESVLFTTKNANAIVSSSCLQKITCPPVRRVIGSTPVPDLTNLGKVDPYGGFTLLNHKTRGGTSQQGATMYTSFKY
ncbi:MAG: glycine/sarcosine/betaine reductase component B subunit [bacterium]|jgi:sarcosine reductase